LNSLILIERDCLEYRKKYILDVNYEKIRLDVWIQPIGVLGVLAGLIFVGLEMRQSQEKACMITVKGGTF